MDAHGVPRATAIRAGAVVFLLAVAAHGRSVRDDFLSFDDGRYVHNNPAVCEGLTRNSVAWAFRIEHDNKTYFHPLTWLSLMADRQVFGLRPWGFHAVNVLLHAVAAVLLLSILLVATGEVAPSTVAAALFAVHPLTVEGVAWVAERKTVLAAALGFAAILAYVLARGRPSWRRLAAVSGLQLASLLAKPGLVVLPGLLLVLDVWPLGRLRGTSGAERRREALRLVAEKVPMVLVSAAVYGLASASTGNPRLFPPSTLSLGLKLANATATVPLYLLDVLWPMNLSVFHPFPSAVPVAAVAAGLATIALITASAAALARRAPSLAAGWAWFCIALLPYLGFKQAGLWPSRADRFAYVPLVGIAMGVAFAGARLWRERPAATWAKRAFAAVAIAALGAATIAQGRHWVNSIALYRRAIEIEPRSAPMQYDLGSEYVDAGRMIEARFHLEEAVRLEPRLAPPRVLLGSLLLLDGRFAEGEAQYREAIRLDPGNWDATMLLAELLRKTGRYDEARPLYARVLQIAPPNEEAVRQQASWFAR